MRIARQRKNNKENTNKVIGNLVKFEFVIKINNFYVFMLYLENILKIYQKKTFIIEMSCIWATPSIIRLPVTKIEAQSQLLR